MPEYTIALPRPTEAQSAIERDKSRFQVVDCGRRFGKSFYAARAASKMAVHGQPVGWFTPRYRHAKESFEFVRTLLSPIIEAYSRSEMTISLITGGKVEFWTLTDKDAGRSRKYALAIVDEAAHAPNLEYAWEKAIRATLTDLRGRALFLSTPNGLNYFYTLYQRHLDHDDWAAFKFPTSANPRIPASEIEEARQLLPDRVFKQEYLAEFVTDGNYFAGVDECATILTPDSPTGHAGHFVSIGVDWALTNDFTVFTAVCRECGRVVDWERINKVDFMRQRERLKVMADHWQARIIVPESNSIGEPNIEMLIHAGLPVWFDNKSKRAGFWTSAASKAMIMQGLALALEKRQLTVPVDYRDELLAYEVQMGSIQPKFSAPDGRHDDRVVSLALAWFGAAQPPAIFI
jgi:hypothetical protein